MRKAAVLIGMVLLLGTFWQCQRDFSSIFSGEGAEDQGVLQRAVVRSGNQFSFRLLRQLNSIGDPDSNLFVSPLSISMALGMTLNGAAEATEDSMRRTLGLEGLSREGINRTYRNLILQLTSADTAVQMEIANSIWFEQTFQVEPEFIKLNREYFFAEVQALDFSDPAAVVTINSWVNERTHGRIPEIIQQLRPGVDVMVLLNAIYFLGQWTHTFNDSFTIQSTFRTEEGEDIPCFLMSQENEFPYLETDEYQAIDLPYGEGNFRMTVILPKGDTRLAAFVANFTPEAWHKLRENIAKQTVILFLPRFKMECLLQKNLKQALSAMGMNIAFTPGRANFSRISEAEGKRLFISDILHRTFVKVNEKGTEAAGATAVIISRTSIPEYPTMMVNRPFLFFIWEKETGAILFVGKVMRPQSE
ncbi:MAG TPA: serpin family protein [Bacteroidetes bacterium]|nr:serpin family protein [Bacteroidota bacterium]